MSRGVICVELCTFFIKQAVNILSTCEDAVNNNSLLLNNKSDYCLAAKPHNTQALVNIISFCPTHGE